MNIPFTKAESLAEQVYRHLRNEILVGNMTPGSKLIESQLAAEWNVSRSPLREAIRKLEQEGLLQVVRGETRLFQPTEKDLEDLYQLRLELEPLGARLAARNMDDEKLNKLFAVLQDADKYLGSGVYAPFLQRNATFHHLIAEFSNNYRLFRVMGDIITMSSYYRYTCLKIFRGYSDSATEHWSIYRAMEARDEDAAWQEMKSHVTATLKLLGSVGNGVGVGRKGG